MIKSCIFVVRIKGTSINQAKGLNRVTVKIKIREFIPDNLHNNERYG